MKNLKNAVLTALMIFSLTSNVSAIFGSKKKGDTELHTAVRNKNLNEVVGILIQNPGLVNSQNNSGDTPLHVAVSLLNGKIKVLNWNNILKICLRLIKAGAKLDIENYKEEIPLDSFVNADTFNRSYLNVGASVLLYFDDRTMIKFFSYFEKMKGYFSEFAETEGAFTKNRLKNHIKNILIKIDENLDLNEIEKSRNENL